MGGKTYSLLQNLLVPNKPWAKSLDELFVALKTHYAPQPIVIPERFDFHKRNQTVNESIADYLAALPQLATHCAFANFLDDALRDHLVCELRSSVIQKRLLSEKELMLATAVELAQSMEAAEANVTKLQSGEASAPINHNDSVSILVINVRKKAIWRKCVESQTWQNCQVHLHRKDRSLPRPALNINLEIPSSIAKLTLYESQLLRTQ